MYLVERNRGNKHRGRDREMNKTRERKEIDKIEIIKIMLMEEKMNMVIIEIGRVQRFLTTSRGNPITTRRLRRRGGEFRGWQSTRKLKEEEETTMAVTGKAWYLDDESDDGDDNASVVKEWRNRSA